MYVVLNLYDILCCLKHKGRCFEECSHCSFYAIKVNGDQQLRSSKKGLKVTTKLFKNYTTGVMYSKSSEAV